MPVSLWDESDSEDELLPGWQQLVGPEGRVLFYNSRTGLSSLFHPVSRRQKRVTNTLPPGWNNSTDQAGRPIFTHETTGRVSYVDPRLLSTVTEGSRTTSRFDQFSTVDDVLRNKDLRGRVILVTEAGCGMGRMIATSLTSYGAAVVCACARCPPDARPLIPPDPCLISPHSGGLFWIPCDLNDLSTVSQFCQIYSQTGWPINVCIFASDHFPSPKLPSSWTGLPFILSKLLKMWHKVAWRKPVTSIQQTLHKIFRRFFPIGSCECNPHGDSSGLTSDGFEVTIQRNYLAQMLLLHSMATVIERTNKTVCKPADRFRVVFLSGRSYQSITGERLSDHIDYLLGFRHVPSGLSNRLHHYSGIHLLQLMFLAEFQKRLGTAYATDSTASFPSTVLACDAGTILSVHCAGSWWKSVRFALFDPVLLWLRFVRIMLSWFTQSSTQLLATPCFCATDDGVINWRNAKVAGQIFPVVYVAACQQKHLSWDAQFGKHSQRVWDSTMRVLGGFPVNVASVQCMTLQY
ncbi:WW domain-containing oxidoreductase [Clonorchis sinensis]|uniref:WW domain-containing oxidoreductase n=1 Tax=Clonorchis sinensis TaxID=79923 RepID=A0A8T1M162_CLOSI|nr:WW domain-containing oxidoreductase [Clonorchis sinensis]